MRRRLNVLDPILHPAYVVWELTLRCDQPCAHCGSRAGAKRENELSTPEALRVVAELAEMKTREVVLIGGEAYLHDGFLEIIRALKAANIRPTMTTGGRGITPELAKEMKAAGLHSVSVSVDGLREAHDAIRLAPQSHASALNALRYLKEAGLLIAANTNLNRRNKDDLEALYELLRGFGIAAWQVQLTVPLGRAADRPQMILQPYDLLELVPRIAALKKRAFAEGILLMPGNNLGYFGPEETLLRSSKPGGTDHFRSCQAGKFVMGIESNGSIKGCPSLQPAYIGGTVRERSVRELWTTTPELAFARERTVEDLWGFCRSCDFAEACMGGCTFTAHALFGRPGNNAYCHYRARRMEQEGKRERLVPLEAAEGKPFDHGTFELVIETFDAPDPVFEGNLVQITRRPRGRRDLAPIVSLRTTQRPLDGSTPPETPAA